MVYIYGKLEGPFKIGFSSKPPRLTIEIAAVELEVLIEHHGDFGAKAAAAHEHETEMFHAARASHLRQRLAMIARHRLTPDRKGHA